MQIKYATHTEEKKTKILRGSAQNLRPQKREEIHYKMNNRVYNARLVENTQNLHYYLNTMSR